jgi:hypothetical protein
LKLNRCICPGEYTPTIELARTLAAEALPLERTLSDGLTSAEIALIW